MIEKNKNDIRSEKIYCDASKVHIQIQHDVTINGNIFFSSFRSYFMFAEIVKSKEFSKWWLTEWFNIWILGKHVNPKISHKPVYLSFGNIRSASIHGCNIYTDKNAEYLDDTDEKKVEKNRGKYVKLEDKCIKNRSYCSSYIACLYMLLSLHK